jgi:hypothetical protein
MRRKLGLQEKLRYWLHLSLSVLVVSASIPYCATDDLLIIVSFVINIRVLYVVPRFGRGRDRDSQLRDCLYVKLHNNSKLYTRVYLSGLVIPMAQVWPT